MRPTREYRTSSRETYKKWKKENKPLSKNVDYATFLSIIETFNIALVTHMADTGEIVRLPYGIGLIGFYKRKGVSKRKDGKILRKVDFLKTNETGEQTFFEKYYTSAINITLKWRWEKSKLKHSKMFKFIFSRFADRIIPTELKITNTKEVDKYQPYKETKALTNFFK